jgi:hypothetical protein
MKDRQQALSSGAFFIFNDYAFRIDGSRSSGLNFQMAAMSGE